MAASHPSEELVELRDRLQREQERLATLRTRAEEAAARAETLKARIVRDRLDVAVQAERVADHAEVFADHLEAAALGEARDRRLRLAAREREIAAIERRNAVRLREAGAGPLQLESPLPLDDRAHRAGEPG